ncbi:ArsC/Spx/MgsR family protein [Calothrix sp. 336/3]|uniref:ArsC/Spx/MgsR family protein n=1 Tax=Calothrix sp. 336/3 TaxID=1337936 RepID=UPI0004E37932|nr:ArsC/Spx/MgsR family protein [Calothrix sp. 336/3]AKG22366.1 nitrogenase-associated protein [Calothrix sp. 336/3]
MARVIFYEKPGCKNNTKQKTLLTAAGHEVVSFSIITEPWTIDRLKSFFGDRPIVEWFNRAAPKVQSGEVNPEQVDAQTALVMMLQDPLLIRRPLMEVGDRREVGFDVEKIDAWIGLQSKDSTLQEISNTLKSQDLQSCSHKHGEHHQGAGKGKCQH